MIHAADPAKPMRDEPPAVGEAVSALGLMIDNLAPKVRGGHGASPLYLKPRTKGDPEKKTSIAAGVGGDFIAARQLLDGGSGTV